MTRQITTARLLSGGLAACALLAAGSAHAAVVGTTSFGDGAAGLASSSASTTYVLSDIGNILVIGGYADAGNAGSGIDFTFDGNSPTGFISNNRGAMAYYDTTGASDTSFDIVAAANAAFTGAVLWEISNVDLSAGVVSSTSDTLVTTEDNTLVLGTGFENGGADGSISATGAVFTSTDIPSFLIESNVSSGTIGGASGVQALAGNAGVSWSGDADGSPLSYGFVVPEPASGAMALIGLGAMAMRRRRG